VVSKKRRYAFHMKGDLPTIEGLLVKRYRDRYILIGAELLEDKDRTVQLAGHVEIPRENVYVLQELR